MIDVDIDNVDEVIIKDVNELIVGHTIIVGRGEYQYALDKTPYKDVFEAADVFNKDREIINRSLPISKFGNVEANNDVIEFSLKIDVRDQSNREWYLQKKRDLIISKL